MQHLAKDIAPVAPSVAVAGLTFFGVTLADWVLLVTLIYTVTQVIIALPRLWLTLQGLIKWLKQRKKS